MVAKEIVEDAVAATPYAAAFGVGPSSAHLILTRANMFQVGMAAGALLLPDEKRAWRLVLAGCAVHGVLSLVWALVLAASLPRRRTMAWSLVAGLAITALDMSVIGRRVIGRRYSRFGTLALVPQVLDHLAFTGTVGYVVSRRRAQR